MQARHVQTAGVGMTKAHNSGKRQPEQKQPATPPETERRIEDYRKCPVCHEGMGGYGVAYSTQGQTRYYRCCKSNKADGFPCGHTWSVRVHLETITIQHREVNIDGNR